MRKILESTNMVSKDIQVYHSDLGDWYKLGEMETAAYCHCLAVLHDYLFVVGGQEQFDNNGNTATNYVYRYDPRANSWIKMKSMLDSRTDFHVSVINGSLFAGTFKIRKSDRNNLIFSRWEK